MNVKDGAQLRVVHVASGDLWAGAEKQLFVLVKALRAAGVGVEVALMNPGALAERLRESGIPTLVFDESRQSSVTIFRALRDHLRATRPHVVHTHRTKENILAGLAAASLGIPSIRTQHGAQEHPRSLLDIRRQVLAALDYAAGRWLQRRIVAVSAVLERELAARFGAAKVVRIENGIDPGPPPVPRDWTNKRTWHIGIVGRQVPVKRVDIFLKAAKALEELAPERQFRFSVIGDGPLLDEHKALAMQLGFRSPVDFTGHVDNAEEAITNLDLLVICSDHEGLPMVALEAMRVGTVVVTHEIGALPELLDGENGGVFAADPTAEAFGRALSRALNDPSGVERRAGVARRRAEAQYSDKRMAEHYTALYT